MKAPERTTYIWRIVGEQRHLVMVCPSLSTTSRYLIEVGAKDTSSVKNLINSLVPHIDTEIPINNEYVLTSYLKWKSKEKQQSEDIIEHFRNPRPQHLRFTGFNYKFEECENEEGQTTTNN